MVIDSDKGVGLARGDQTPSDDDGDRFLGCSLLAKCKGISP